MATTRSLGLDLAEIATHIRRHRTTGQCGALQQGTGKVVVATWAYQSKSCSNARLEEALALRAAMIRAKQPGWKRVEFESNCKHVVDKVN